MSTYTFRVSIPQLLDQIMVSPVLAARKMWYGYSFRRIPMSNVKLYAIVDADDYYWLSQYKWRATYNRNTIYAIRSKTVAKKRSFEMMHRAVMEIKLEKEWKIKDTEHRTQDTDKIKSEKAKGKNHEEVKSKKEKCKIEDGYVIDHINHNGLDNRKANLRIATIAQNSRNRIKRKGRTCRYRGVTYRKKDRMYIAEIRAKERMYLGCFKSEIEAAKAYDAAARKYHGEFASLNFATKVKQKGLKYLLEELFKSR